WFHVIPPREDLREGRPLDASEFAVHLDQVREGHAPVDYQVPQRFFERTYMTRNLTDLAAQVVRRLSGEKVETSAVFNMSTQFGGGKTHALTLLYHLAQAGPAAEGWPGMRKVLERAAVAGVPRAATAAIVGTNFDARWGANLVLAVSIPASELEMKPEDQRDFEALKKLLERLGKAIIMSAETESAEIIRRRLFEWHGLPEEGRKTAAAYAEWVLEHRHLVGDFDANTARERFLACYPMH